MTPWIPPCPTMLVSCMKGTAAPAPGNSRLAHRLRLVLPNAPLHLESSTRGDSARRPSADPPRGAG